MSRGAAEGVDIIESGGGMSVIWQCGLESVLSRGECLYVLPSVRPHGKTPLPLGVI